MRLDQLDLGELTEFFKMIPQVIFGRVEGKRLDEQLAVVGIVGCS